MYDRIRVLCVTIVILSLSILNLMFAEGGGTRVDDPVYDMSNGVDIPTWRRGDYWNYSVDYSYDLGIISIPLSGWINMSLDDVFPLKMGTYDPSYMIAIEGNVSGSFITEKLYVEIRGYVLTRIQDLSNYILIANTTVSGTVEDLNGFYPFGYEYDPPLEEYDFPLIPGDSWNTSNLVGVPFSGDEQRFWINQTRSCGNPLDISVEAGDFIAYPISVNGETGLWYNSTAGNAVKRLFSVDIEGTTLEFPLELRKYRHYPDQDTKAEVISQQHVWAGDDFTVSCLLDESITMATSLLFFPGGNLAYSQAVTEDFTADLTAPMYRDHTHSDFDHGSFGVLLVVYDGITLIGMDVCTVTTKSTDLFMNDSLISVEDTGSGTIDDLFTMDATVINPSSFKAEGFRINLTLEGERTYYEEKGPYSLEARENLTVYWSLFIEEPGNYRLLVRVDPDDNVTEYDEENNQAELSFTVYERPPLIWNVTPAEEELRITEGEEQRFHARASRNGSDLPTVTWYVDGKPKLTSADFKFVSDYTGKNSSKEAPFVIECWLPENSTYPGEREGFIWNLTVIDVNRPPEYTRVKPSFGNISAFEGDNVSFDVSAVDRDGDVLVYNLTRDGLPLTSGMGTGSVDLVFLFHSNYTGSNSSDHSPIEFSLRISDGSECIWVNWTLEISNVDRLPEVGFFPAPGGLQMKENETLEFGYNATDPDGDPAIPKWYLDSVEVGNASTYTLVPEALGLIGGDRVNLNLTLMVGDYNESAIWTIDIISSQQGEPETWRAIENLTILSPEDGTVYYTDSYIEMRATSTDERDLRYTWYVDGEVHQGSEVSPLISQPGVYTVELNCTAVSGIPGWGVRTVTISVEEEETQEPIGGEDDDDSDLYYIITASVGIIALLILMAIVIFSLLRKREEDIWED